MMRCSIKILAVFFSLLVAFVSCNGAYLDKMWESNVKHEDEISRQSALLSELEDMADSINLNIYRLSALLQAKNQLDRITSVDKIFSEGELIGYRINFVKNASIEIYNGKDVDYPPVISLRVYEKDTTRMVWVIDGTVLTDNAGNPLFADGEHAVVPVLKIQDGKWWISYDPESDSWTELGRADGLDEVSPIQSIDSESDPDAVIFTMKDGGQFRVLKYCQMSIYLDIEGDETSIEARREITLNYRVDNPGPGTFVTAASDGNYKVRLDRETSTNGKIIITGPKYYEDGFFTIMASDETSHTVYRVVNFYERKMYFGAGMDYCIPAKGGEINVPVTSNFEYRVVIPQETDWLTEEPSTKAQMVDSRINLSVAENRALVDRESPVYIYAVNDPSQPLFTVTVTQQAAKWNIDRTKYNIRYDGATIETDAVSSFGLRMESNVSWLDISYESQDQVNYHLKYDIKKNDTGNRRSATVAVYDLSHPECLCNIVFTQVAQGEENPDDMIFIVRANFANDFKVTLPLSWGLDYAVDWGDGSVSQSSQRFPSHHYPRVVKDYTVRVSGIVMQLCSNDIGAPSVKKVVQWGQTGLTSLNGAFYNNTILESIPGDTDASLRAVNTMGSAFCNCVNLSEIPGDLLAYASNVTDCGNLFRGCTSISVIPEHLLDVCVNLNTIEGIFAGCNQIRSIPRELFWKNTRLANFNSVFDGCSSLEYLPEKMLVNCNLIKVFSSSFAGCSSLTYLPEDLFAYCPEMNALWQTFVYCKGLESLPVCLFDNNRKLTISQEVFFCCGMKGETPYTVIDGKKVHLYEREYYPDFFLALANHYGYNRTYVGNEFTDQEQIPLNWKN